MIHEWSIHVAYWKNAKNLEQAQEHKFDLICRKLDLKPGMKLLDIGCGWGGLALYAAQKYGVSVVGVTISKEQAAYAQEFAKDIRLKLDCKITEIWMSSLIAL